MNYNQTLEYLFNSLPMFHRIGAAAYKSNLDNTLAMDEFLGHPHSNYPIVHVAGTNGKGSVSHLIASVLQSSGMKTGLFTSPHLKDFRERIRLNGKMIEKEDVSYFVNSHFQKLQEIKPSFFEMTAVLAFEYFSKQKADIAVIETGMGGRLDSTNIVHPILSVITNIGYDHTQFLGNTLEKIALEKAGIIKKQIPVVIGEWHPETAHVFTRIAQERESPLWFANQEYHTEYSMMNARRMQIFNVYKEQDLKYRNLECPLSGFYQSKNILTVLKSLELLIELGIEIDEADIYSGVKEVIETTGLRGRWEEIGNNPLIVCDTAHNEDGIREVVNQLKHTAHKKLHMVFGMVEDKDREKILTLLPSEATYYFCRANLPRGLNQDLLRKEAGAKGLYGESYPSVKEALETAKKNASPEDMIFVGGSTFIVAEAL